jgi:tetratricopeptide (TPR) repeat protein
MLGRALDHQAWDEASGIVRALGAYWDTRGLREEAAVWTDILDATAGPGQNTPIAGTPAGGLWLYTTTQRANRQHGAGQLDQAEQTYQQALAYLQDQPETEWIRSSISVIYHQLGMTAQDRGRLDEADDWCRKSLTIKEEFGNHISEASTYQLGLIAQDRERLDEADDWYRKALAIEEELDSRLYMARTYVQLGSLAEDQGRALLALTWNIRCVTLFDEFPSPLTRTGPSTLVRLTRQLGLPALEETWQQVTGQPLPQAVRDYVTSHQDEQPRRRVMTDPVADAARSAAVILAADLGPHLPAEVEAALAARGAQQRPDRFLDPSRSPA